MKTQSKQDFKNMIIYQVWPRSFKDSNGDGIGDIPGIIEKLDHIRSLGVDMIWLSPVYASGNRDWGYDIDDYYAINSEYGTMEDFDALVAEARKRDMGIMMDLVANHTSDKHDWFKKALETPDSPWKDYYIFRKGKHGPKGEPVPPNNWMSAFGGSAWQYDVPSDSWYLTIFTPNQCDLNWENEAVREGMYDVVRFWLAKGVSGLRMDAINTIGKSSGLPDAGPNPDRSEFPFEHIVSLPQSHAYLKEMREKALSHYPECVAVGEGMVVDQDNLVQYTKNESGELDLMFQFDLSLIGCGALGKFDFRKLYRWSARDFKRILFSWQRKVQDEGGWLGVFLSNHDYPRQVSRFGNDKRYRVESAKALALLNFTLRGTPFIYQGEEIGMTDLTLKKSDWRDPEASSAWKALQTHLGLPGWIAERVIRKMSRDNSRTPVQWTAGEHAGFSTAKPWIIVNPNYREINADSDLASPTSIIAFYRKAAAVRKSRGELSYGTIRPLLENHPTVIAYLREHEKNRSLVLINLSARTARINLGRVNANAGPIASVGFSLLPLDGRPPLLSARSEAAGLTASMRLKPYDALIYDCSL